MKKILLTILWLLAILMPSVSWAQSSEPYAVLSDENTKLTFYYDDQKTTRSGMSVGPYSDVNLPEWRDNAASITTVVFDDSFASYTGLTNTSWWFDGCSNLTTITGMANLKTDNVTDMTRMFCACSSLTSIDLSNLKTDNVTTMSGMFYACGALESLDLSSFNTENLEDMHEMFTYCQSLTSINLSSFNTLSVATMAGAFDDCRSLTSLDLSSFNTSSVLDMSYMFHSCLELVTIYVGTGWNTAAVTSSTYMFTDCTKLVGGAGTVFDESYTDYTYAHIDGGTDNPGYFTRSGDEPYVVPEAYAVLSSDNTTLTFYYDKKKEERSGMDVSTFSSYRNRGWHTNRAVITNVIIDESFASYSPTSTAYWFYGMTQLTSISGLQNLNTSSVTDMKYMFYECQSLQELDFSNFLTSSVTSMAYMFSQCSSLTALDLSAFNTSQVTDMTQMFYHCSSLVTISVSALWSISAVTAGETIFAGCYSLIGGKGVPFNSNFPHIANAHIDGGMSNPGYLTDKNASVEDLAYAALTKNADGNYTLTFYYDINRLARNGYTVGPLTDYAGYRGWNSKRDSITNVVIDQSFADFSPTSISYWFDQCENIEGIEGLEYLKTDNVQDMICVFRKCAKLEMIDISGFKTPVLETISSLFQGCTALKTIFAGDGWNLDKLSWSSSGTFGAGYHNVFTGCTNLVGGEGTKFQSNWDEATYAHIDGGTSNPGYFTDIADKDKENEAYAVLSEENTKLTFYYNKHKEENGGMSVGPFEAVTTKGWDSYASSITTVVFDNSFANNTTLTSTAYWLGGLSNLSTISGLENLNTSTVTSMSHMFADCSVLTSIDLSSFNTQNVTDMSYMFRDCSGLTSLDLSTFNVQQVTNMSEMFRDCSNLTSLNLSGFDTQSVTDMSEMFYGCSALTSLDLSSFNTQSVTTMNYMFGLCTSLTNIDFGSFNTANVTNMSYMFYGCSALTSLDLSSFNTANVTDMRIMFSGCTALTTIYVGSDWTIDGLTEKNVDMFSSCENLIGGMGTTYDIVNTGETYAHIDGGTSNPGYFTDIADYGKENEAYAVLSEENTKLTFYYDKHKDQNNGMSVGPFSSAENRGWNDNASSITSVVFDSSFANDTTLTSTANWFSGMSNLTAIDGLQYLNTKNVTDMVYMFSNCSSLTSLDVTHFNTQNVTNMAAMFNGCSGLTSLDVTGFNTQNVTNIGYMFQNCSGLTSLDVTHFNTQNVWRIDGMFASCSGLTSLDVTGFNTQNVTTMGNMFWACSSLTSLDLSNFNTRNVTNMNWVFWGCSNLTTIYAGDGWSTAAVSSGNGMFDNCTALVGGTGTVYDAEHTDYTYAHIDGGTSNPGYFTMPLSMGDANGDGSINIADAVATVTNILGEPANGNFYRYAADMNNDSVIDIFDVTLIVNAALNAPTPAPALTRGSIDYVAADAILLTSEENSIYMGIDQAQQYTAFQFDIDLPEGMSLVDVKLPGMTDHRLSYVQRGANQYRVVALSMSNEMLRPTNGHVIQLQVSNTAGESNVKVSNVLFVTPLATTVTGINEHLNANMALDGYFYDLKGRNMGKDKQQLGKGIYIMNHKKVIIK